MGDMMRPMSFGHLMDWIQTEYAREKRIFGVGKIVTYSPGHALPIFGEKIESPFGPAAGPNTQLAQNIIAAYAAGARFFELKTVQIMDGEELSRCISKPCITCGDEGYNCEWSTELTVPGALEEYIKGWFACKLLAREYGLGDPDGFVFNMSVGYDLRGIQSEKINDFIDSMMDAGGTAAFQACMDWALQHTDRFRHVDEAYIRGISPRISRSITESTLHGCPPDEIERIATYLLCEKHLNTYVKCNPTLLGYDYARNRLNELGYDYIAFDDRHFREDLQWCDAVAMFERLMRIADEQGLTFGVKLSNTFPVDVKANELPATEMYMSGRALYPLTLHMARMVADRFDGKLRISFSGGASLDNAGGLFEAGIWPVTMATTILKPGGYERMSQICESLPPLDGRPFSGVDGAGLEALEAEADRSEVYRKPVKPLPDRHMGQSVPLFDCFEAPCRRGCPIGQDIPAYLREMERGDAEAALEIILARNPLPFITGTICPHHCGDTCMRSYYEGTLRIRETKLAAADAAAKKVISGIVRAETKGEKRVAIVGGGPAGLAAAAFLARAGVAVTVFEKRETLGGIVRHVIPSFRIDQATIDRDIELVRAFGGTFRTGVEITSLSQLRSEGFTEIILATGAWKPGRSPLKYGTAVDALEFLETAKKAPETLTPGTDVVVLGGGNTAMDTARAAIRLPGVQHVRIVYRRTRRYMPADEEELEMAVRDGVEFLELLAPEGLMDNRLTCTVMELGEPDASGRRSPKETGRTLEIPATMVISATGERIDPALFSDAGIRMDDRGRPVTDENRMTSVPGIYAIGDCAGGPATVVEGIADAMRASGVVTDLDTNQYLALNRTGNETLYAERKGVLYAQAAPMPDRRCLGCATRCGVCSEVCPNRANVLVRVPGKCQAQVVHVDGMCNECGNCAVFCPYTAKPYRDKFTLFWSSEDFENSGNAGFMMTDEGLVRIRMDGRVSETSLDRLDTIDKDAAALVSVIVSEYAYLLKAKA